MKRREELDKYRDLSKDELKAEAARLKESLFRLNFKLALGEVDAVKRIRQEKSKGQLKTCGRGRGKPLVARMNPRLSEKHGRRERNQN